VFPPPPSPGLLGDASLQLERPEFPQPGSPMLSRQREPRENGDFLRVIVLEMNMRRVGKLDAKTAGRARVWLPPRKATGGEALASGKATGEVPAGEVPARWVGVAVDDL